MEAKYTPGPWVYRPNQIDDWGFVRASDGGFVCQAKDPRTIGDDLSQHRAAKTDPWEANARLIAAAPALVEALKELVLYHDVPDEAQDPVVKPLLKAAFAALAQASGGE